MPDFILTPAGDYAKPPTIAEQISCIRREIRLRERLYPRFVKDGRLSEGKALSELMAIRAVLASLRSLQRTTE